MPKGPIHIIHDMKYIYSGGGIDSQVTIYFRCGFFVTILAREDSPVPYTYENYINDADSDSICEECFAKVVYEALAGV